MEFSTDPAVAFDSAVNNKKFVIFTASAISGLSLKRAVIFS